MLDEVEDRDDVGVQASPGRAGLDRKPMQKLLAHLVENLRKQGLDGHRPIDLLVVALVDDADRSPPDDPVDAVLADPGRQGAETGIRRHRSLRRYRSL